jgi:hypothetical protein
MGSRLFRSAFSGAHVLVAAALFAMASGACSDDERAIVRDAGNTTDDAGTPLPEVDASSPADAGTDSSPDSGEAGPSEPPDDLTCIATGTMPGGRTYCEARLGGTLVRIADKRTRGPAKLLVFVHSDGGTGYYDNGGLFFHLAWAEANNARVVSVLAPNGCAWWQAPSHNCASAAIEPDSNGDNAPVLHAALNELRTKIMLNADPIYVHADSGGAIFVSYSFLPKFGDKHPGRYAINCGGVASPLLLRYTPSAALLATTRIEYTYGDRDYQASDAHSAFLYYQNRGFRTGETILPNVGHCEFNTSARADAVFSAP